LDLATDAPNPAFSIAAITLSGSTSPEQVTEPFVTSSTVTPGNSAKAFLILSPQPDGQDIPVTSKLTWVTWPSTEAGADIEVELSGLAAGFVSFGAGSPHPTVSEVPATKAASTISLNT
jgi:hypothetical protein